MRFVKGAFKTLLAILLVLVIAIFVMATITVLPGEKETPSGLKRNQALYVEMRDGVKIAIDVWLPEDYSADQKIPAMLYMSRYWRAEEVGPLQRAAIGVGLSGTGDLPILPGKIFNKAGYAFVQVDARGTGASFGSRDIEFGPEEVADYGELAQWISEQSWSNGNIGAIGISYNGNTSELISSTQHPAIKAVAPLYSDFDPQFGLVQPGGAFNSYLDGWGAMVGKQDRNDICGLAGQQGIMCWLTKLWVSGVKPVDGENAQKLLEQAVEGHKNNASVAEGFGNVQFRDDTFAQSGLSVGDVAPYGLKDKIEGSGVPMHVWTGWLDAATTDGALSRYLTFSNRQELIIGPYNHGGFKDVNPFAAPDKPVEPSIKDQWSEMVAFFDREFGANGVSSGESNIRYFTFGSDEWRETKVWPPLGLSPTTLYFAEDNTLSSNAPIAEEQFDNYTVDFDVTTGSKTRWHTNMSGSDVVYSNRKEMGERLLTYTTDPLDGDLEITGSPVLTLYVSSSSSDGVFHAYLEAVAPTGEVIYLTEGVLRAIHPVVTEREPVYEQLGPHHSYLREDSRPMKVGEVNEISFGLYSTSVVVPKGYSLRLALAGADTAMFKRWPENETPEWEVRRDSVYPSKLEFLSANRN